MRVTKRDGCLEDVSFDKVLRRIQNFCKDLDVIDPHAIAQLICGRIYDSVKTSELDELTAQICYAKSTEHPQYGTLAARITISNYHKATSPSFSETIHALYHATDADGRPTPLVSNELYEITKTHKDKLNTVIDYDRDYLFDYFGFKTLERAYLLRINDKPVERPQHMWMRVALGIHGADLKDALECYDLMSTRKYTHATPTLFNAGTPKPQMSSCFLTSVKGDSVEGMYDTIKDTVQISKHAGGIGMSAHPIRSRGSYIRGTNGYSTGLTPFLRVVNESMRHINQAGKRNGSAAIYLEPWHADVLEFISLRRNTGAEEERCRDLFVALWIPDLFMERVQENGSWSLFCPDAVRDLHKLHGDAFKAQYEAYERAGKAKKVIKAQNLWIEIIKSQIETGGPYMLYKDKCQRSNQKNLGTLTSSNLCSEILIYNDPEEYGVCNLASIVLPSFVDAVEGTYNFAALHATVKKVTRSMEKVITKNYYPIPETERSNARHRPIGIGIQGLADTFILMRYPYESAQASDLNKRIAETIYHASLMASMELSRERAAVVERLDEDLDPRERAELDAALNRTPAEKALKFYKGAYSTFYDSPASHGILQFDMWTDVQPTDMYDWHQLKKDIVEHGLRHSLNIALMPTASTSQIMGYTESFEPITSNIYQRRTLAGEFVVVNKYLVKDLIELGLWSIDMKNRILSGDGSIQQISEIPAPIRELYKTVWEIKQRVLIDQSADRGPFVCHTQSLNLYVEDPDMGKISNMHFYAWKKQLKTGLYYLRSKPKAKTMSFTLAPTAPAQAAHAAHAPEPEPPMCRLGDPSCAMCSS